MSFAARPATASSLHIDSTLAALKFGALPPRRMMWQSSLPAVWTIAEWPPLVTDRK